MGSRRAAILGGPASHGRASGAGSPQWHELLTRVEVLLATLREQVAELEASEATPPRRGRRAQRRDRLLGDIDAARSAVKHARRRMASLSPGPAAPKPAPDAG
jgi:hypothetical protein